MPAPETTTSESLPSDMPARLAPCRFSVIVPAYNRAALLTRCLDSILAQVWEAYEVIVVDDGSNDGTRALVDQYIQRDNRVRYVYQANAGAAAARNRGAEVARGGYLTFLDSDDEAAEQWMAVLAAAIDAQGYDVVCCGIDFVNAGGNVMKTRLPESTDPGGHPRIQGLFLSGTFAVSRAVFSTVGNYAADLAASQHSEWRFRLFQLSEMHDWKIGMIASSLVRAHDHAGPKIRRDDRGIFESARYVLERHGSFLMEQPRSFASWAAAAGTSAARIGRYAEARTWFGRAFRAYPRDLKNGMRLVLACLPGLRERVWRFLP